MEQKKTIVENKEDKKKFAFDKTSMIMIAAGFIVIVIGFLLMIGPSSSETHYEPDIFSFRRISVAPVICFLGYIWIIFAILRKPKDNK
jgi:hypothetical protein